MNTLKNDEKSQQTKIGNKVDNLLGGKGLAHVLSDQQKYTSQINNISYKIMY
jgi:hypothetical protein